MPIIGNDWDELIAEEFEKDYYLNLRDFLKEEYKTRTIYPDMYDIFNAVKYTPYSETKVVILGQDPYINQGEAHGLSFSVKCAKTPPSLMNIFKELYNDLGVEIPKSGCLLKWASQGVLLLNAVLTVRAGESNSHKGKGWEKFTDRIIQLIDDKTSPVVFMLWGRNAQAKQKLIKNQTHLVLSAAHPSPLANGAFFGCRHFSRANDFLISNGVSPVDWQL